MVIIMIIFFFFNDTATTEIYTLSLHDALPISGGPSAGRLRQCRGGGAGGTAGAVAGLRVTRASRPACGGSQNPRTGISDRKSTRLNSSHANISYVVFCLKKKKLTSAQSSTIMC